MQAYSDPKRADDPHALPDVEYWYHTHAKREPMALNAGHKAELYGECVANEDGDCGGSGWYWWPCSPGCLPEGDPIGPFATEAECIADFTDSDGDE